MTVEHSAVPGASGTTSAECPDSGKVCGHGASSLRKPSIARL